jgi:hypothetical protein
LTDSFVLLSLRLEQVLFHDCGDRVPRRGRCVKDDPLRGYWDADASDEQDDDGEATHVGLLRLAPGTERVADTGGKRAIGSVRISPRSQLHID